MTTQMTTSKQDDLFFIGLGIGAGVALVFGVQALWSIATAVTLPSSLAVAVSSEAQTMGLTLARGTKAFWYVARAGGLLAYLLLWLATLWGVLISSKMVKGWVDGTMLYDMHEFLPMLAMVFAVVHAAVLLGDAYIGFRSVRPADPLPCPYRPLWTGLGSLALYLSLALIASFYLRSLISRRMWRLLHYLTYLAFGLALIHGLLAGTDSSQPVVYAMYIATGATLLFATIYRVLAIQRGRKSPARDAVRQPVMRAVHSSHPASAGRSGTADLPG